MRNIVASFRAAAPEDRERQAKLVRIGGDRVLDARVKLLGARIAALSSASESRERDADELQSLKEREAATTSQGLAGVLADFGVAEAMR